jgi:hypothetical protein
VSALREIFARFGVKFDSTELKKGDAATKGAVERLQELGKVLAGGAVVQGVRAFAARSAEIGTELRNTGNVVGVSTDQLQAYRIAAQRAGVGADQLNDAFKTLANTATDAAQGGGMREVFAQIGVSATDTEGRVRPLTELLPDIAANLNKLATPAERSAFLMKVLGESAGRLTPLFANGTEGIEAAMAALEALGGGASEDFIEVSARLSESYQEQDTALLSLRSRIGVLVLPIIDRLVQGVTKLLTSFFKMTDGTNVLTIALTAMGIAGAAAGVKILATFAKAILVFAGVAIAAAALILVIDDLWTHFQGGRSVLGGMFEGFLEDLTTATDALITNQTVVGQLVAGWKEFLRAIAVAIGLLPRLTNALGLTSVAVGDVADPGTTFANLFAPDAGKDDQTLAARQRARAAADAASGETRTVRERVAEILRAQQAAGPTAAAAPRSARRGGAVLNSAPTVNISVSGQGLDERGVAEAAARAARREIEAANRDALEDLEGLVPA